jgi:hypothetical protein
MQTNLQLIERYEALSQEFPNRKNRRAKASVKNRLIRRGRRAQLRARKAAERQAASEMALQIHAPAPGLIQKMVDAGLF